MTREELVNQKAQEFTSSGEFSPSLTECFIAGAEWEHNRFMEKACWWLRETAHFYVSDFTGELDDNSLLEDFKKAMEE